MSFDIALGPVTRRDAGAVLLRRARIEAAAGALESACVLLRRAIAVDTTNLAARIELADCLSDRRRFRESSRVLETAFLLARGRGEALGNSPA